MGVIIFIAPLLHIDFPKVPAHIEALEAELSQKAQVIENDLAELRAQYEDKRISAETYISLHDQLSQALTDQLALNSQTLDARVESERIFGWKTMRIFLVGFGIRLPYLLFSLLISILIFRLKTRDPNLNRAFLFLQVMCYTISFYELTWVFWHFQDYPIEAYRIALIGLCIVGAIAVTYLIKYLNTKAEKHKSIIRWLMEVLVFDAKKEAISQSRYDEKVLNPTIKELHERTR